MDSNVTNEERDLVFEIANGNSQLILLIGHMRMISMDARDLDYIQMLRWLKSQNLIGLKLKEWMREKQNDSILQAIAFIRMRIYSGHAVKKIYAIP